jgi:nitrite transporter NirC
VALTLVVFAGAELFTGEAMYMLQGIARRTVSIADLLVVWIGSLVGNLVGAVGFAAMVHAGGTLTGTADSPHLFDSLLASLVKAKVHATSGQLFWRAVLCNFLVCLGLWMAGRTRSDAAKILVLWWALLAFVASGFEHSVANMTLFSLAIFAHHATASDLTHNLAYTVPGNIVGGGLLVGAAYAWIGHRDAPRSVDAIGVPDVADRGAIATQPIPTATAGGSPRRSTAAAGVAPQTSASSPTDPE